ASSPLQGFLTALGEIEKAAKMARKHRLTLIAENHYALKARSALSTLKRDFTILRAEYPSSRSMEVSKEIDILAGLVAELSFERGVISVLKSVGDIRFHVEAELAAALQLMASDRWPGTVVFLPPEI